MTLVDVNSGGSTGFPAGASENNENGVVYVYPQLTAAWQVACMGWMHVAADVWFSMQDSPQNLKHM